MDYFTEREANKRLAKKKMRVASKTKASVKAHRTQRRVARKGDKWYRESMGLTKEGLEKLRKRK